MRKLIFSHVHCPCHGAMCHGSAYVSEGQSVMFAEQTPFAPQLQLVLLQLV